MTATVDIAVLDSRGTHAEIRTVEAVASLEFEPASEDNDYEPAYHLDVDEEDSTVTIRNLHGVVVVGMDTDT